MMYVKEQQRRHHDIPSWQTFSEVVENLGGSDSIYGVWSVYCQVSSDAQKRICGFTDMDIDVFLESDDAGRVYAETICR